MSTWIADDAVVLGDVVFGEECSVFYHTTIRAEDGQFVFGDGTNIQDNCVIHGGEKNPVTVGKGVTIGHSCIIHGCTIGDNTLIGMGSIIMDHAQIGNNCVIGAGSLVTENTIIPDNSMAFGRPAKVVRPLNEQEIEYIHAASELYIKEKELHRQKKLTVQKTVD